MFRLPSEFQYEGNDEVEYEQTGEYVEGNAVTGSAFTKEGHEGRTSNTSEAPSG